MGHNYEKVYSEIVQSFIGRYEISLRDLSRRFLKYGVFRRNTIAEHIKMMVFLGFLYETARPGIYLLHPPDQEQKNREREERRRQAEEEADKLLTVLK